MKTAKFVADLPDEVITTHILPRLPAKSVGRCRCVSKPWRSLLSSPEFAKTHLKSHADDPDNLIMQFRKALNILDFTGGDGYADANSRPVNFPTSKVFLDDAVPQKVKLPVGSLVVGSCDGLILITTNMKYFALVLVNPITLEYAKFPQVSYPRGKFRTFGLGYDSSSDDYKIVKLSESSDCHDSHKQVDVYSVKMKRWKRIGHTPHRHDDRKPGAFLNGCIHWVAGKSPSEITIAAFNLAREEFDHMPFPSGVFTNKRGSLEVKVLKNRLTLIHKVCSKWGSVDVWVMEEYGVQESWTKLATIFLPENRNSYVRHDISCMLNGDEIIMEWDTSQLIAYNWRTEVVRDVIVAGYNQHIGISCTMAFRESIVSPNRV